MTHHLPAPRELTSLCPATAGVSASLATCEADSSVDVTNILACAETERKNMSSDASRHELQHQRGLNAEAHYHNVVILLINSHLPAL